MLAGDRICAPAEEVAALAADQFELDRGVRMLGDEALRGFDQVRVERARQSAVGGEQRPAESAVSGRSLQQRRCSRSRRSRPRRPRRSTARAAASRAYGRAAITRSCARRSFAAETIFMALVICCVFLTERMRRRMSIRLGIGYLSSLLRDE